MSVVCRFFETTVAAFFYSAPASDESVMWPVWYPTDRQRRLNIAITCWLLLEELLAVLDGPVSKGKVSERDTGNQRLEIYRNDKRNDLSIDPVGVKVMVNFN